MAANLINQMIKDKVCFDGAIVVKSGAQY